MRFLKVNLLLLTICLIASVTALDSKIVLAGGDPSIKDSNILGNSEIAPKRKNDPGPNFKWEEIR